MSWIYKKKEISSIEDFPKKTFGFIYITTHTPTGKKYLGKKFLFHTQKKKLTKKELLEYDNIPGRKPSYRIVKKESDWKTYFGSHILIKEWKENTAIDLEREIIHFAYSKKELTYLECKYQFLYEVLENENWLNDNILGKFYKKDFAE